MTVRAGRYGPYVAWGKVFATIPKSMSPDTVTLADNPAKEALPGFKEIK